MPKNIFTDTIGLDTHTVYHENGNITTVPCPYEENPMLTTVGHYVSQKGRMVTAENGHCWFQPYHLSGCSRYHFVFSTCRAEVKESGKSLIVTFRLPKKGGMRAILRAFREELYVVMEMLRGVRITRKGMYYFETEEEV